MTPAPGEPPGPAWTVLLVDDDPFMLDMLPRRLQKHLAPDRPVRVLTAKTPEEAEAYVQAGEEGLLVVICDFNLRAAKDGIDVLRGIEARAPRSVRILYSGHAAHEIGPRLGTAPIHAFVEKPFRLEDMLPPLRDAILDAERALG